MRFPIKETVFTAYFLLTISFFVYIQPARAENTVAFKIVILPAKKIVVEDIGIDSFRMAVLRNKRKISSIPIGLLEKNWNIFYKLQNYY